MEIIIKPCVGVVIFNKENKIFLMSSPKWKDWLVPGGRIEEGESPEKTLYREIEEELQIEIKIEYRNPIVKIKPASADFKKAPNTEFHFTDFYASTEAAETDVKPNSEISAYKWLTLDELDEQVRKGEIVLMDSTEELVREFREWFQEYNEAKQEIKGGESRK